MPPDLSLGWGHFRSIKLDRVLHPFGNTLDYFVKAHVQDINVKR
jgi:hypothetical protein